jgi:hypothetical protein
MPAGPDIVRASVLKPEVAAHSRGGYDEGGADSYRGRAGASYEGTRVLNSELLELASAFDDIVHHEPVRMERVLSRGSGGSGEWSQPATMQAPQVVKSGIDDTRLRTLSQTVERSVRPLWLDIALVGIMVVVGLGVGFAVLSVALPNTFAPFGAPIGQQSEHREM